MKKSRLVSLSLIIVLALLTFSFGPLASLSSVRPAAAQLGEGSPCAAFNAAGGVYHRGVLRVNALAGESVRVSASNVTPIWAVHRMTLRVWKDASLIAESSDSTPSTLSYTFPEDGIYSVAWFVGLRPFVGPAEATWVVTGVCQSGPAEALPAPGFPPAVFWPGHPDSPDYDGRINAEPVDRYAVYCISGQLQVWDGKTNVKMGALNYEDISAMPDPSNQQIGDIVFLGRSNNILTVNIGPQEWIKDNIKLEKCISGQYKSR